MRIFRRDNGRRAATAWIVEVDYGVGFVPYSGTLDRRSAEIFARDLRRVGRTARLVAEHDAGPLHAVGSEPRTREEAIDQRVLLWKLGAQRDSSLPG